MKICWKNLATTILLWLLSEILLNFLGLDNLADYGEFIGKKHLQILEIASCRYSYSKLI